MRAKVGGAPDGGKLLKHTQAIVVRAVPKKFYNNSAD